MDEKNFDLIEQFTRVEWLLHRYHQQNHMQYGPMGDPRRGQGRVLALLKLQPEISQKDLSFLLAMRPQSLGELLAKLERNGFITRTPAEADRRVMNIKLTQEGARATEATGQEFSFDQLFECLSEAEQQNLSGYLRRIIETIEAQLDEEQPGADFDPRGRPCGARWEGRPDWGEGRGYPGARPADPRLAMGRDYPGNAPLDRRPGMMPSGHRRGGSREPGERHAPSPDQPKEE